jgi:hypothetical protein
MCSKFVKRGRKNYKDKAKAYMEWSTIEQNYRERRNNSIFEWSTFARYVSNPMQLNLYEKNEIVLKLALQEITLLGIKRLKY